MRYKSFRIQNFKGIKDTVVNFDGVGGASVFAFVGLNESGKTTVLEAIYSFSPDDATDKLVGGNAGVGVPAKKRVPRHEISSFTGDVKVTATVEATDVEVQDVLATILSEDGIHVRFDLTPKELYFERIQRFKDGDFVAPYFTLLNKYEVKDKGRKKWRKPTSAESLNIRSQFYAKTPDIAYFPTFVFDFPEFVFLTDRGGRVHEFYRAVFQDILDQDGRGHSVERDIIRRVRSPKHNVPWASFLSLWSNQDDSAKIQQVLDRASAALTKIVIGRWNAIFGDDAAGKEIIVSYEIVEGEVVDGVGAKQKTEEHDVKIKFEIKDGTRRFPINDRSLGFRWFFSFLLFTQFRVARAGSRPILFLFDEPAANLHAAAQQRLIECFPEVGKSPHTLAYSTHSHYMIEPKWLEQTYIVSNRADSPKKSIIDEASLDDDSLDVQVESYRSFVDRHPQSTSYFQPILDRLDVVPSRFDIFKPSVVVEGKSDYYILRYCIELLGYKEFSLIPGLGAGTFGALAALNVGWNLQFIFLLDGDKKGMAEKQRYSESFGVPANSLMTLTEIVPSLTVIEDLLDNDAEEAIKDSLSLFTKPNKAQLKRFFQEALASGQIRSLGPAFEANARALLDGISTRVPTAPPP